MTSRRKGLTSQLDRNFVEDDAGTVSNCDVLLEPVTHPEVDVCKDNDGKFRSPMPCVDWNVDEVVPNADAPLNLVDEVFFSSSVQKVLKLYSSKVS